MPGLPVFFDRYAEITLSMNESDRWIDVVHGGWTVSFATVNCPTAIWSPGTLGVGTPHFQGSRLPGRFGMLASVYALDAIALLARRSLSVGSLATLDFTGEGRLHIPQKWGRQVAN